MQPRLAIPCFSILGFFFLTSKLMAWTNYGVRPLGMGNAFVSVVDDQNALYYNPAGLALIKDLSWEIINPAIDVGANTLKTSQTVTQLLQQSKLSGVSGVLEAIQPFIGVYQYGGFSLTPYLISKNWGFSIAFKSAIGLLPHNNIALDTKGEVSVIAPLAFAKSFLKRTLHVGMAVKFLSGGFIDDQFNLDTLALFSSGKNDSSKKLSDYYTIGWGVGFDAGALVSPKHKWDPSFGLSISDIGSTSYRQISKTTHAPKVREMSVNTGLSFKPYKKKSSYLLISVDTHSINQKLHFSQKLNMGLEYSIRDFFKIQAGLMTGYPTAGVQIQARFLSLRLATYVVDHGTVVGLHKGFAARRYVVQLRAIPFL